MRIFLLSAFAALIAAPALAETITAPILAYDRVAKIIVLKDKTVWTLASTTEVPEGLVAGDTVTMTYAARGDDGLGQVTAITKAQ